MYSNDNMTLRQPRTQMKVQTPPTTKTTVNKTFNNKLNVFIRIKINNIQSKN